MLRRLTATLALLLSLTLLAACLPTLPNIENASRPSTSFDNADLSDTMRPQETPEPKTAEPEPEPVTAPATLRVEELRAQLDLVEDMRAALCHGPKPAQYQSYIVMHDTEGGGSPENVIDWWDGNGNLIAAHFVVGKDGHIAQCVPLDTIAHHAGFGNIGHNELYGIVEDGRDDMIGTKSIGANYPDYGMNAWSIGIEMVHIGGEGDYPQAQLEAVDKLIAYLDAYFSDSPSGDAGTIIDHKAWRNGNSDTSPEFANYLANYQDHRNHA